MFRSSVWIPEKKWLCNKEEKDEEEEVKIFGRAGSFGTEWVNFRCDIFIPGKEEEEEEETKICILFTFSIFFLSFPIVCSLPFEWDTIAL